MSARLKGLVHAHGRVPCFCCAVRGRSMRGQGVRPWRTGGCEGMLLTGDEALLAMEKYHGDR